MRVDVHPSAFRPVPRRTPARSIVAVVTATALAAAGHLAATSGPDSYRDVRLVEKDGSKTKMTEVMLRLEEEALVITPDPADSSRLATIPYRNIKSAVYSYSKSPRWKTGAGVAVAVGIFAIPIFFMKGKKHWLTVQGRENFAVLQLDKRNYKMIVASLETRAGVKVEDGGEEQ
jgi:hypothetical protein